MVAVGLAIGEIDHEHQDRLADIALYGLDHQGEIAQPAGIVGRGDAGDGIQCLDRRGEVGNAADPADPWGHHQTIQGAATRIIPSKPRNMVPALQASVIMPSSISTLISRSPSALFRGILISFCLDHASYTIHAVIQNPFQLA